MFFSQEILGAWVAAFLTLAIFSFLYSDNPIYKAAEHLFVGISAAYALVEAFWQYLRPNLFDKLFPMYLGSNDDIKPEYLLIIPLVLGIMMLFRLIPSISWMARYPIAYIVGVFAGLRTYTYLSSDIINQIKASQIDFGADPFMIFNSMVLFIGTISGLMYFFFSREHTGFTGSLSRIGIYFLMISFGASFGFNVMGRISLLIGRFSSLIEYNDNSYSYGTSWMLVLIIIILALWYFMSGKSSTQKI